MVPTGIGLQAVNTTTFSPERKTNVRDETLDAVDETAQTWMNNVHVRPPLSKRVARRPCGRGSASSVRFRERVVANWEQGPALEQSLSALLPLIGLRDTRLCSPLRGGNECRTTAKQGRQCTGCVPQRGVQSVSGTEGEAVVATVPPPAVPRSLCR